MPVPGLSDFTHGWQFRQISHSSFQVCKYFFYLTLLSISSHSWQASLMPKFCSALDRGQDLTTTEHQSAAAGMEVDTTHAGTEQHQGSPHLTVPGGEQVSHLLMGNPLDLVSWSDQIRMLCEASGQHFLVLQVCTYGSPWHD